LTLSVVTLIFLAIDTLFQVTPETSQLFFIVDTLICLVFLGDVAYRGFVHPDRKRYWRWGWIDLLSSIPAVTFLRWGRAIRIIRIIRVIRAFRSVRAIFAHLFRDPAKGSIFSVALASFVLIVFGSIAILNIEAEIAESNIQTASDALWWSFVTVTTVGYGDTYPVSNPGRALAALLMATGVGLFGTLTAYFANAWLREPVEQETSDAASTSTASSQAIAAQLAEVLARLERLEAHQTRGNR
jgi:voltage-gated potassium channel